MIESDEKADIVLEVQDVTHDVKVDTKVDTKIDDESTNG
jgi:hypothetical protein